MTKEIGNASAVRPSVSHLWHDYLLAAARRTPDAPAVVHGETLWTYTELARRVDVYARALHAHGLRAGERIVLEFWPCPEAVALEIAAASVGLVFVPIAPDLPESRRRSIIQRVAARAHFTAPGTDPLIGPDTAGAVCGPDGDLVINGARRPAGPCTVPTPEAPLYIIFTSGSTGEPKGIVMSHRAVVTFHRGIAAFGVRPHVRLGSAAPIQFDFSILDLGMALGAGGTLVQVPRLLFQQPHGLVRYLARHRVTQINGVPSIWRSLLAADAASLLTGTELDTVLYGGEAFDFDGLSALRSALPELRLVNLFGQSESIACAWKVLPDPLPNNNGRVPFGARAIDGLTMYLIGSHGERVTEPNKPAELYIEGDCLFDGYWGDPVTTRTALVDSPLGSRRLAFRTGDMVSVDEDGEHYFHSRRDNQVKVGGNRVELEEIEVCLASHPRVRQAVAVHIGSRIEALLQPHGSPGPGLSAEVRKYAHASLPRYMVPARMHVVHRLPLTANGKIDRKRLAVELARPERATTPKHRSSTGQDQKETS